jgi:hypothetical protein
MPHLFADGQPNARRLTASRWRSIPVLMAVSLVWFSNGAPAGEPLDPPDQLREFLAVWSLDRSTRGPIDLETGWKPQSLLTIARLLDRLAQATPERVGRWAAAAPLRRPQNADDDELIQLNGQATLAAELPLPPEVQRLVGRERLTLIRFIDGRGRPLDILTQAAPQIWPRDTPFATPVTLLGMPLTAGPAIWPEAAENRVQAVETLIAVRMSWHPPTVLGSLGMDYGLFETVEDGRRLVPGDTEAFFDVLAAAGRAAPGAIEAAAGPPADLMPLLDPAVDWFAAHRGEAITVEGIVRRVTRIGIDSPSRRSQVGRGHYWELVVFVTTPVISVDGSLQDSYPLICCILDLPEAMPTGDHLAERIRLSGFAFKRYRYPVPPIRISSSAQETTLPGSARETPLILGRDARWQTRPQPSRSRPLDWLGPGAILLMVLLISWAVLTRRTSLPTGRESAPVRVFPPQNDASAVPDQAPLP